MNATTNRRAILGAVFAAGAGLSGPARAAIPIDGRATALARRITGLLHERDANEKAVGAALSGFRLPPTPPELMMRYRGPLGDLKIEADGEWLRDLIPHSSPLSRRGRRLRRLLRIHEDFYARVNADRKALAGPLFAERRRIERELEAAAAEVCDLEGSGAGHAALQAATRLVRADGVRDVPTALLALLKFAGAA